MTFSVVGSIIKADTSSFTVDTSGAAVGDLICIAVTQLSSHTVYATALSSSNVTWTLQGHHLDNGTFQTGTVSLFTGKVTALSSQTVTTTWSGSTPATIRTCGRVFSVTAGNWHLDAINYLDSAGTDTWQSLTPAGSGELYWGFCIDNSSATAGSTTGFTYENDDHSNGEAYNTTVGSSTAPVWGDSDHTLGMMMLLQEENTSTGSLSLDLSQSGTASQSTVTKFPANVLAVKVELLLGDSWTDVTSFVYQRADIHISSRGRPNEASKVTPSQCSLVMNNRNGNFSPKNTGGLFYPYVTRNVQIRVSVGAKSADSTIYSGYRFWGEVSTWPVKWDRSGNDVWVEVEASGLLRRYVQGGNVGSPLKRFFLNKTDTTAPVALWPMEELSDAAQFVNSVTPGDDMAWGDPAPTLAGDSNADGTDPLPLLSKSVITGTVVDYSTTGFESFGAGTHYWTCPSDITSLDKARFWGGGGGGGNHNRGGGGGGEYAEEDSVAVTPGTTYTIVVGSGGANGTSGSDGGDSSCAFDSVTVTAHGGSGAQGGSPYAGGAGGTGSSNTTHHDGGAGGAGGAASGWRGGGGGGASGSSSADGGDGSDATSDKGGAGGLPTGAGGDGGNGGDGSATSSGGGGGTKNYSGTYAPVHTYAYQGSDGATANALRATDGYIYQGDDGYNGKQKTWVVYDYATIAADLSGSTPFLVLLLMHNILAGNGVNTTMAVGHDTKTSFGSTESDPSGANIDVVEATVPEYSFTSTVIDEDGTEFGTAFESGGATSLVMFKNSNSSDYSGTFDKSFALMDILYRASGGDPDYYGRMGNYLVGNGGGGGGEAGGVAYPGSYGHYGYAELSYTPTGTPGRVIVRFVLSVPSTGAVDDAVLVRAVIGSGSLDKLECYYGTGGKLGIKGSFSGVSAFDSGKLAFSCDGQPMIVSIELQVSGADLIWAIRSVTPGATSVTQPSGYWGTYTTATIGPATSVVLNPAGTVDDTAVGMVAVQYAYENMVTSGLAAAFGGHDQERAGDRFERLCSEQGIDGTVIGHSDDTPYMGPQRDGKLTELLQDIEDVDQGLVIEARDKFGLYYRTRADMISQGSPPSFDYSAGVFAEELSPVPDDSLIRNDVTVTRVNGGTTHAVLDSGSLSNQDPPDGVGEYTFSLSPNLYDDSQLPNLAEFLLSKGTVDELRYPSVVFDLARSEVESQFDVIPAIDGGDYFTITNLPSYADDSTADQLAVGFDETLNARKWRIELNAVPESPYELNYLATGDSGSTDNSDFEDSAGSWNPTTCTLAQTTDEAYSGTHSLEVTMSSTTAASVSQVDTSDTDAVINNGLSAAEGDLVFASAYVKTASQARTVYVSVGWYDSSGSYLSSSDGDSVTETTEWQKIAVQGTAPASTYYAVVTVLWGSGASSGDVHYVDNAQQMGDWW